MKNIFKILVCVFLLTANLNCRSQSWLWAKCAAGSANAKNNALALSTGPSGDVFVTGIFQSTVAFGTTTLVSTGPSSVTSVFLAKYDSNGNILWAKSVNSGVKNNYCYAVSADQSGNVFISGMFNNPTITFGTYTLTNTSGSSMVFVAKYDANGNVLWAKSAGGVASSGSAFVNGISTDASGNAIIGGSYSGTLVIGTNTFVNLPSSDAFTAKYDPTGNVLWAKISTGSNNTAAVSSVASDLSGNIYITGEFGSNPITFGTTTLTTTGLDLFLTKYDMNGNVLWAKNTGGSTVYANGVSTDPGGNAYITGNFYYNPVSFGTTTLTNAGLSDVFISKYDPNGNVLWAKGAGGSGQEYGYSVSGHSGGVYATGFFANPTISFGTNTLTVPTGTNDPMFIVNYDLNGNLICADALSSGGANQNAVSADPFGNANTTGTFWQSPLIVGTNTLTSAASLEIFVAKFSCTATGIKDLNENVYVKIFPNPASGNFTVVKNTVNEIYSLEIYNCVGKQLNKISLTETETKIDIENFSSGIYFLKLLRNDSPVFNTKIIVR